MNIKIGGQRSRSVSSAIFLMAALSFSSLADRVMALITLIRIWDISSAHELLRALLEKLHTMLSIFTFIAVIV